jgi:hypothetical protein
VRRVIEQEGAGGPDLPLPDDGGAGEPSVGKETQFATPATAAVGLYLATSYTVARRTREIGIPMAIGDGRRDVMTMVLREAAVLGWAVGIPTVIAMVMEGAVGPC